MKIKRYLEFIKENIFYKKIYKEKLKKNIFLYNYHDELKDELKEKDKNINDIEFSVKNCENKFLLDYMYDMIYNNAKDIYDIYDLSSNNKNFSIVFKIYKDSNQGFQLFFDKIDNLSLLLFTSYRVILFNVSDLSRVDDIDYTDKIIEAILNLFKNEKFYTNEYLINFAKYLNVYEDILKKYETLHKSFEYGF
jgi:hypothetical protein